jgi:glycosyltransferase involved in cell wall biosynthesis
MTPTPGHGDGVADTADPLVSIVIPVHNRPALLRRAVESALAQTWRPLEVIIVDDGSTDETPRVIAELTATHPEVRGVRQINGGPGRARETGRQTARGTYLQYLDSDDLLLPRKIALQVDALIRDPDATIAYGRTRYRDAAGREIACTWKPLVDGEQSIFPAFLRSRAWETVSPLYRREWAEKIGPWSELRLEEDWEYDGRAGAAGARLTFVPEVLAEHRDDAGDRLSRGGANDPARLADRAVAHLSILQSARRAGIEVRSAEMQHFARELFLLARMCGAAGLTERSRALFGAAREASGDGARRLQFRMYAGIARLLGWGTAGRMSALLDRVRW